MVARTSISPTPLLTHAKQSGGSIVAAFLSRTAGPLTNAVLSTAVRTEEQAQRLSKLGINVLQLDLHDETAVENAVLGNESASLTEFRTTVRPSSS